MDWIVWKKNNISRIITFGLNNEKTVRLDIIYFGQNTKYLKNIYKGGTEEGCYYKRFQKDPNTEWAINHHVAKSGQDKFAREVYDYVRQNDILLRKE